jgi:hypothetical protein
MAISEDRPPWSVAGKGSPPDAWSLVAWLPVGWTWPRQSTGCGAWSPGSSSGPAAVAAVRAGGPSISLCTSADGEAPSPSSRSVARVVTTRLAEGWAEGGRGGLAETGISHTQLARPRVDSTLGGRSPSGMLQARCGWLTGTPSAPCHAWRPRSARRRLLEYEVSRIPGSKPWTERAPTGDVGTLIWHGVSNQQS